MIAAEAKRPKPNMARVPVKKVSGDLLRLARVVLNVLNKVAPGSNLRAYIEELRTDGEQQMAVFEEAEIDSSRSASSFG